MNPQETLSSSSTNKKKTPNYTKIKELVNKDDKINKKDLLLQIYDILFPNLSNDDKQQVNQQNKNV